MLIKLTEKGETELQQKDLQLATVEAKLCQVLLQLDKMKRNEVQVSSEQSEEKVFVHSLQSLQMFLRNLCDKSALNSASTISTNVRMKCCHCNYVLSK